MAGKVARKKASVQAVAAGTAAGGPAGGAAVAVQQKQQQRQELKAKKQAARQQGAEREHVRRASEAGRRSARPLGEAVARFPRKALLAELVVCLVVVWGGALVAPQGPHNGTTRAMVKSSGLAAVFLVLALVSSAGKGASKAASAFGALVAIAYLFTSEDATALVKWVAGFWSPGGVAEAAGAPEAEAGGSAGAAGGPREPRPGLADASSTPGRPVYV